MSKQYETHFSTALPIKKGVWNGRHHSLAELNGTNKLSSLIDVTISVPYQKHFESCMKLFISDRCVFCDFNTSQACRKTFQEWSWKIKYFIWFRHKNPMVNNNLNLPKGFMNSMNSKAIAILFLGISQFATSMSKAIQLAYLSSSIYDLL